jgi:hypothetical protein
LWFFNTRLSCAIPYYTPAGVFVKSIRADHNPLKKAAETFMELRSRTYFPAKHAAWAALGTVLVLAFY